MYGFGIKWEYKLFENRDFWNFEKKAVHSSCEAIQILIIHYHS